MLSASRNAAGLTPGAGAPVGQSSTGGGHGGGGGVRRRSWRASAKPCATERRAPQRNSLVCLLSRGSALGPQTSAPRCSDTATSSGQLGNTDKWRARDAAGRPGGERADPLRSERQARAWLRKPVAAVAPLRPSHPAHPVQKMIAALREEAAEVRRERRQHEHEVEDGRRLGGVRVGLPLLGPGRSAPPRRQSRRGPRCGSDRSRRDRFDRRTTGRPVRVRRSRGRSETSQAARGPGVPVRLPRRAAAVCGRRLPPLQLGARGRPTCRDQGGPRRATDDNRVRQRVERGAADGCHGGALRTSPLRVGAAGNGQDNGGRAHGTTHARRRLVCLAREQHESSR